jgi:hypothetical protein
VGMPGRKGARCHTWVKLQNRRRGGRQQERRQATWF